MKEITAFIIFGLLLIISVTYISLSIRKHITAINTISCYSGGVLIYQGESKGRVASGLGIEYTFDEAKTGKEIRVSGNCVIQESHNALRKANQQQRSNYDKRH